MRLGMVGGGRAAWAFGSAWRAIGRELSGVMARSATPITSLLRVRQVGLAELVENSEIILVAVSDSALATVARSVAESARPGTALFHPSGSESSQVFTPQPLAFSLHPLRSLPPPGEPCDFSGTLFTYEGSAETRNLAQDFVRSVRGRFAEIAPPVKPLYHAAAVFASNYVEALLEVAAGILRDAGIKAAEAAIANLAKSAIDAWLAGDFTGPVARGDRAVIDRHLAALARNSDRAELYRLLAAELSKALQAKRF